MSQGGVSQADVHRIVDHALGPVHREVNALGGAVREVSERVVQLEVELAGIGNAIQEMTNVLSAKLDGVAHGQERLLAEQQSTHLTTHQQFVAANAQLHNLTQTSGQGFVSMRGGLDNVSTGVSLVDGSVKQMTIAMAQMEVIRIMNDAKGPIDRLKGFSLEIDERFGKAVENVYMIRTQYDQLAATALDEHDRKLRTIGEHIFAIYEQDFRAHAETPLCMPPRQFVELPMEVDDARLNARAERLEGNLLEASQRVLEPLLEIQRTLEHEMASRFATDAGGVSGELAIPLDIRLYDEVTQRPADLVVGARLEKAPPTGGPGTSIYYQFAERTAGLASSLGRETERLVRSCETRLLTDEERASLQGALADLATKGAFDHALLAGYEDYLAEFGLELGGREGARG